MTAAVPARRPVTFLSVGWVMCHVGNELQEMEFLDKLKRASPCEFGNHLNQLAKSMHAAMLHCGFASAENLQDQFPLWHSSQLVYRGGGGQVEDFLFELLSMIKTYHRCVANDARVLGHTILDRVPIRNSPNYERLVKTHKTFVRFFHRFLKDTKHEASTLMP